MKMGEPLVSHNLPWVEKYRPEKLDDLIAHEDIIRTINKFVAEDRLPHLLFYGPPGTGKTSTVLACAKQVSCSGAHKCLVMALMPSGNFLDINKFISEDRLPHLLFYGPPGTGKTSTILACAKQIYSPAEFSSMVLELNASDDRGIGVVREQILSFASTRTIFKSGFKLIILDEADAMTNDAQNALRRVIEKFTENTRFCLICNYLSKITPAIQSRCTRFRFGPLSNKQILPRLDHVIEKESLNVTKDGKKALMDLAQGDMRKVINVLQCAALAFDVVNEENVYACVGHPLKSDMEKIVNWLLNDDFKPAYKNINELKILKGLALQDILTQVHLFVHRIDDLPDDVKIHLLEKMADIENHLASGTSEKIQLSALISAFQVARDMVA